MEEQINLYDLVAPIYTDLIDDLRQWHKIFSMPNYEEELDKWTMKYQLPSEYIMGGGRQSAKTFSALIIGILACLSIQNTLVLIDRRQSNQRSSTFDQLTYINQKVVKAEAAIGRIKLGDMEIAYPNNSTIIIRSVYSPQGIVEMKGLARKDDRLAILISEESNTYKQGWFTTASEAVVAKKQIKFKLFNTDRVSQYIVGKMQEAMPENEAQMVTKGYQKLQVLEDFEYTDKDGKLVTGKHIVRYYRTNYRVATKYLTNSQIATLHKNYKDDPIRGRVARDGLNGLEGIRLYYNLAYRHFINPLKFEKYKNFIKLPHMLFVNYRIGIDEGHAHDMFAIRLWGITKYNRAIWLEDLVVKPPRNRDLNINNLAKSSNEKLRLWAQIYQNMKSRRVNIRVEWAGNGVAIMQELSRLLKNSGINYTIDKAKKNIKQRAKKQVGSNEESQPEQEARAAIKNLLLGRNQILFWNADEGTINEYFGRARDDENRIVDADNHRGDADDYALIPKYEELLDGPPKITFEQELDEFIKKYHLKGCDAMGRIYYV